MKETKEWKAIQRDGEGKQAMLVLVINGADTRLPTFDEAHQAASYLNEQDCTSVTLYCRTEDCKSKGAWIQRTAEDAKKNLYPCEGGCGKPMVR